MLRLGRGRKKARRIDAALLRSWPLPEPAADSDKEGRGTVLVAGGSSEVPGGLILAGIASLRAGAGKLQLAAPESIAPLVAVSVVESRVFPLSETADGSLSKKAGTEVRKAAASANAVLIGPGMIDEKVAGAFTREFLRSAPECPVLIDAACIGGLSPSDHLEANAVLTPHAGEMAALFDTSKEAVERAPADYATDAALALGAVIVMKGATTFIAAGGELFSFSGGDVGLATSGSGDVLSGIITGLMARGADPDQAAVWGVAIHAEAGNSVAARVGRIGFLARELLDEIPRAMIRGVLR